MSLNLQRSVENAVRGDVASSYESFFGMSAKPFDAETDPKFFFRSEGHGNALEILRHEMKRRDGHVVVTGQSGIGRTTLCRVLADAFDRKTLTALVLHPPPSEQGLLTEVLRAFGIMSTDDPADRQPTTTELTNTLHEFLRSLEPLDARATLILDDAHRLSLPLLERLDSVSTFVTENNQLLQMVLVGDPALLATLQSPSVRQLDERIGVHYRLEPLAEAEVPAYVAHRLAAVDTRQSEIFSAEALHLTYEYSRGVPATINLLCDRALLAASLAQNTRVDEKLLASVATELGLPPVVVRTPSLFQRVFGRSRRR